MKVTNIDNLFIVGANMAATTEAITNTEQAVVVEGANAPVEDATIDGSSIEEAGEDTESVAGEEATGVEATGVDEASTTEEVVTEDGTEAVAEVSSEGAVSEEVIGIDMGGSDMGMDIGTGMDGIAYDETMGTAIEGPKDPLLSSWPVVIGISSGVLLISIVLGALLAKRKIKKGIDLYED